MAMEGCGIRKGIGVVLGRSIMAVNKGGVGTNGWMVSFYEAVAIRVGREGDVSLGVSVWYRGCRDGGNSSALFESDVDKCVEAQEGTWVWMVSERWELVKGGVVGCDRGMGGRGGIVARVGGAGGSVGLYGVEGALIWGVGEGGTRVSDGAVEDGEERGGGMVGWLWVVEEGIDGAGSVGASVSVSIVGVAGRRGRVAEEGGNVHSSWGHGSIQ